MKIRAQYKSVIKSASNTVGATSSRPDDEIEGLKWLLRACVNGDLHAIQSYAEDSRFPVRTAARSILGRHIKNTRAAAGKE